MNVDDTVSGQTRQKFAIHSIFHRTALERNPELIFMKEFLQPESWPMPSLPWLKSLTQDKKVFLIENLTFISEGGAWKYLKLADVKCTLTEKSDIRFGRTFHHE
jgi:hypothetical protein